MTGFYSRVQAGLLAARRGAVIMMAIALESMAI